MRNFLLIVVLVGMTACSLRGGGGRADADVVIPDADFNFGVIPDTVTDLTHCFHIVNNSADTVRIERIEKSCGCTTFALADSTVMPGDSVALNVKVTVARSFNFFERNISVFTSASPQPLVIYLRASRKRQMAQLVQEFPLEVVPGLRVSLPYLIMGFVAHGSAHADYLNLLNTTDKPISYKATIPDAPTYISIYPDDEPIQPGDTGRIAVMVDLSDICDVWGVQRYSIRISALGSTTDVPMEAIFTQPFDRSLPDKPVIMMPVTAYKIDPAERPQVKFELFNIGNSSLQIRDMQVLPEGAVKASMSATTIEPGQKAILTVDVPSSAKGKIEVGISSNCPNEPYKLVTIYTPE